MDDRTRRFIADWDDAVGQRDLEAAGALLAEHVAFWSPAVHRPLSGRDTVTTLLGAVMDVFGDLVYTDVFSNETGGVVMQFATTVHDGDRRLDVEGVDVFQLDDDGQAIEMRVMLRPFHAVQAMVAAMEERLRAVPGRD
jgi:ketosteroid isomerase-like protein